MILNLIFGLLFIFFLPGFTMVNALFPRSGELDKEFDMLYRVTLGMGMSIVTVILVGFFLGSLPVEGEMGHFVGTNIWAMLISLTVIFFVIGWYKGAYQWMGWIHPALDRPSPSEPAPEGFDYKDDKAILQEMQKLARQRQQLKHKLKEAREKSRSQARSIREHYSRQREMIEEELKEVDDRLRKLEKRRSEEIY